MDIEDTAYLRKNLGALLIKTITSAICIAFSLITASCHKQAAIELNFNEIEKNPNVNLHSCDAYEELKTPIGNLQNNVWNAHSAGDYIWQQCIGHIVKNGTKHFGWVWSWPDNGDTVYAQPQITFGNSPWQNHEKSNNGFPLAIDQLDFLRVKYDLEMTFNGELNLASTLWLTDKSTISRTIDKSSIKVEFMIWTYATKNFYTNPGGKKVANINIDGLQWEVWLDKNWHDKSGINENNWTYLAFRTKENHSKITLDIAEMLKYSRKNGFIDSGLYIADIQLGNEVMSGTGHTWINEYSIRR